MIEISDIVARSVLGSHRRLLRVESWLDGELLDDDIPVDSGWEEVDRASAVPERVTLVVPRYGRDSTGARVDYTPTETRSPLAANGQRLRITLGVGKAFGAVEWITRGWFVLVSAIPRGNVIDVELGGLLYLISEARLINPAQPAGTFKSTIRSLVEPALTVEFDAALSDRSVPASINYDDDRLGALNAVLAAWPATADVTEEGFLYVTSTDDPTVPVLELTDGVGGTVVEKRGESTRVGVYNAVVFQGTTTDGGLVRGVAYDNTGPKRSGGPFNPLPVPLFQDSPLTTTQAQVDAAALSRLRTLRRTASTTYDVECVPHPALQAGDAVLLDGELGIVEASRLPLKSDGGTQSLAVRVAD
jgi:hypothetical protein